MRPMINGSAVCLIFASPSALADRGLIECSPLDIPVVRLEPPPSQYEEFCKFTPEQCVMTGEEQIKLDRAKSDLLEHVNRAVNEEIELVSYMDCYEREEFWTLPTAGYGDCEDLALEKRSRLVQKGLPSAALTMSIVHHTEQFFAHAILMVETDRGTLVLDNLSPVIACWDQVPYEYERRERADGAWSRFERPN